MITPFKDKEFYQAAKEKYNSLDKELERMDWLYDYGLKETDVMMDDEGREFVYTQAETDHSERYDVWFKKVELPWHLQTYNHAAN